MHSADRGGKLFFPLLLFSSQPLVDLVLFCVCYGPTVLDY